MSNAQPSATSIRLAGRRSPYQGLVPYSSEDADWFFGREAWCEIVIDNLHAYRVSVLYGESGVGKSSLLEAAVLPRLQEEARTGLAAARQPDCLAVSFSDWSLDDPLTALKDAISTAGAERVPGLADTPPQGSLREVLASWSQRTDGVVYVVLDQLEEFFLYHSTDMVGLSFEEEFADSISRSDVAANFLLSIREDALAKLDRLQARFPGLLDNLLRLEHLDHQAAREAIEHPLKRWNRLAGGTAEMAIEPTLVEAVLTQVEEGKLLMVGVGGVGRVSAERQGRIEAPYLQLVMIRVWDEEVAAGSRVLHAGTLERLGGAGRIVRTHLDDVVSNLSRRDRKVAARAFRYLVTPSGSKIAHRPRDLAEYTGVPEGVVTSVLEQLAGEARILRPVPGGGYEIYHDVLTTAILDWRRRYEDGQSRRVLQHALSLSIAAAIAAIMMAAYLGGALHGWEVKTLDARFSIRGTRPAKDVAVVGIDDPTFQALKLHWPFPRSMHAKVIDRLCATHPRAIAMDIQFSEFGTAAEDNALARALQKCSGRVVLATTEYQANGRPNLIFGAQALRQIGAYAGNASLPQDADGVTRDLPYATAKGQSLALVAAQTATGQAIEPQQLGGTSTYIDYAGPAGTISATPYWKVLKGRFRPALFRDKVVVVGATAPALQDVHRTPTADSMSGPEIQANAIDTALRGFPLRPRQSLDLALIALLALLVPFASVRLGVWKSCVLAVVVAGLYVICLQLAFNRDVLLPAIYPLSALALGTAVVLAVALRRRARRPS
jgi:CHASE2 domain-containing sensor protein